VAGAAGGCCARMALAVMSQAPPMISPAAANAINPRRFMVSPSVREYLRQMNSKYRAISPLVASLDHSRLTVGLSSGQQQRITKHLHATAILRYVSAKGSGSPAGGDMRKTLRIIDIST